MSCDFFPGHFTDDTGLMHFSFFHFADDMGVCVFWVSPTTPMPSAGTTKLLIWDSFSLLVLDLQGATGSLRRCMAVANEAPCS